MSILIAIPVFNEHKYVDQVLGKVRQYASDILMVDDGSTDGTAERLAAMSDIHLVRHPKNIGYGQSIISAFNFAEKNGYDWVITLDCDEQHEPERIPEFIREIETDKWDVISGSRYMDRSNLVDLPPGDRRAINASLTAVINTLFDWTLSDTFCGFKAHRVSAVQQLQLDETGYAFPMQLWPRLAKAEMRVTEIPVSLIYNDLTRSFGGRLNDAHYRMKHYLEVLTRELDWTPEIAVRLADEVKSCEPCCCE